MWRNYFLSAVRSLSRNKIYSLINVAGLAIGVAASVLIYLYIQDELSYDRFHSKADRIYRLVEQIESEGQGEISSSNPFPVGPAIQNDYGHLVQHAVRLFDFQRPSMTLAVGNRKINEEHLFFADSTFFGVFDFQLEKGDPQRALAVPNSIVLTQKLAEKYFGTDDPIGQVIRYEGGLDLIVTGVAANPPKQSHIYFEGLISFKTLDQMFGAGVNNNWVWNPCWTYLLFNEDSEPEDLQKSFPEFIEKYYPTFMKPQVTHSLQPLTSIHLQSHLDYEMQPNGRESDIQIFAVIGFFILLIAAINFMNLATARSANRAREVGMRKVLGASRFQLVSQFLGESVMLGLLAVMLALVVLEISLPFFNQLAGKTLALGQYPWWSLVLGLGGLGVVIGMISGFYPAFYLSGFRPVEVFRKSTKGGRGNLLFRRMLVVVQFSMSVALIISTLIIYEQFGFLRQINPGFNETDVVVIPVKGRLARFYDSVRDSWVQHPDVLEVSCMNDILGENHNTYEYNHEGMQPEKWKYFPCMLVDEHFLDLFEMKIVAGRGFSESFQTDDSLAVIINEALVGELGWGSPEEALGRQFHTPDGNETVVGVVKNFNYVSVEEPIGPFALNIVSPNRRTFFTKYIAVRIHSTNQEQALAFLEEEWGKVAPQYPFDYFYLADRLDRLYKPQDDLGNLVGYFSVLAMLIASLGLFALASFTAEQRTKEIGVRKVLGASTNGIMRLLGKEFFRLVLLANILAWPVTYWAMNNWLSGFAYRIEISALVFAMALFSVLFIAMITIIFHTVRVALLDPVSILRDE